MPIPQLNRFIDLCKTLSRKNLKDYGQKDIIEVLGNLIVIAASVNRLADEIVVLNKEVVKLNGEALRQKRDIAGLDQRLKRKGI